MRALGFATLVLAASAVVPGLIPDAASSLGKLQAQANAESFEFALFSPVQVRSPDVPVRILRLSLIYGENVSVRGLDVGLVARNTGGVSKGLQYGFVGITDGDFVGWQNTVVNITRGEFVGLQTALYNEIAEGEAFQFGLINRAESVSGFQLGFVNLAQDMYGLQIGLINVIESKTSFSFLPIVNWSF